MSSRRAAFLVARSVLLEAVRRKEMYAIVLVATLIIGAAGTTRFFSMEGLDKFFREVAVQIGQIATALAVITLAARQLPREFEQRTIYPLLAKPVSRWAFLAGKYMGVLLAGMFCQGLFLLLYLAGVAWIGASPRWWLLLQCVYLHVLALMIIAALSFALSLLCNKDAAMTIAGLLYILGQTYTTALDFIYDYVPPLVRAGLVVMNFAIPQFALYDLSAKLVHGNVWQPVPGWVLLALSANAAVFVFCYLSGAYLLFRRRPL